MNLEIDEAKIKTSLEFIFSWLVLASISIISAGKLLAKSIPLTISDKQLFRIHLIILDIRATDQEVILGFSSFIATFFLAGVCEGPRIHCIITQNFGLQTEQFNSICVFSSFLTAFWSFILFLYFTYFFFPKREITYEERNKGIASISTNQANNQNKQPDNTSE